LGTGRRLIDVPKRRFEQRCVAIGVLQMRRTQWLVPLFGLLLIGSVAIAQAGPVEQGHIFYTALCASCHGTTGEGDGPAASTLSTRPSNLRLLSARYGNPLPEDQIARFIDGRLDVKAHGPRDMPVWSETAINEEGHAKRWVAEVVAYLQSIQKREQNALRPSTFADESQRNPSL
jgi:mono/diheme cytochrome c family protein